MRPFPSGRPSRMKILELLKMFLGPFVASMIFLQKEKKKASLFYDLLIWFSEFKLSRRWKIHEYWVFWWVTSPRKPWVTRPKQGHQGLGMYTNYIRHFNGPTLLFRDNASSTPERQWTRASANFILSCRRSLYSIKHPSTCYSFMAYLISQRSLFHLQYTSENYFHTCSCGVIVCRSHFFLLTIFRSILGVVVFGSVVRNMI